MKTTIIIASLFAAALSAPTLPPSTRRQAGGNLQTFTAALGGMAATPVTNSGNADRPFQVKGDTFVNIAAALARSCDQQFNACANKANGGDATLSVSACSAQQTQCTSGAQSAAATAAAAGTAANAQGSGNAEATGNTAANGNANDNTNVNASNGAAACTKKN